MKRRIFSAVLGVVVVLIGGLTLAACDGSPPVASKVQQNIANQQSVAAADLNAKQPVYYPPFSNELRNINERTARLNDPNLVTYVTILTINGGIVYNGSVKGKVSSTDSQNTPEDALTCQHFADRRPDGCGVVKIPQPDGSWSTNGGGYFWFDANGHYHEINGTFIFSYSDAPQTFTTPPILSINTSTQVADKCDKQGNNCKP